MSKAGSTALQGSLHLARSDLLEKGVLYPENPDGIDLYNHRLLNQPLSPYESLPGDVRRKFPDEKHLRESYLALVDGISRQIADTKPRCLVLSSEHIFRPITEERAAQAHAEMGAFLGDDTEVLAYIRRPSSRYMSSMQQKLRHAQFRAPGPGSYRNPVIGIKRLFGDAKLHLVAFDRSLLVGGSTITDFASRFLTEFGVDPNTLPSPRRTNESLSAPAIRLLSIFAERKAQGQFAELPPRTMRREISRAEKHLNLSRPKIHQEAADRIDYANDQPLWLRDTYGVIFPDFDYARLERGEFTQPPSGNPLEGLMSVDEDEVRALAERVERKTSDPSIRAFMLPLCGLPRRIIRKVYAGWGGAQTSKAS
ncbi:MAG: hypothetical protein AAGF27_03390 [Pseudomonadota bacterium]